MKRYIYFRRSLEVLNPKICKLGMKNQKIVQKVCLVPSHIEFLVVLMFIIHYAFEIF